MWRSSSRSAGLREPPPSTASRIARCCSIVAAIRPGVMKSWLRTGRIRSFTWRSSSASCVVPGRLGQPPVELLVEQDELGVEASACRRRRSPLLAQDLEHRAVVAARRACPPEGEQLERPPHLVELADRLELGLVDPVAALGVPLEEPLGVEPEQRLAHRRAGDPEPIGDPLLSKPHPDGDLPEEDEGLQLVVGEGPGRIRTCIRACRRGCAHEEEGKGPPLLGDVASVNGG